MLTEDQIQQFKKRLEKMKEETEEELEDFHSERNHNDFEKDRTGEVSSVADHPGNLGTEQFEQEKDLTFYEQSREHLMEINDALKRIEEGRFGVSEKSGKPIPIERLEVQPTARLLVEEAEERS
ncbi:hypothetical protein MUN89_09240 [Halobacillus salinarum]|uniref:DksA C4-type domain-containing protein n=1 Tax=Halobacillus salinarum TaxID=2932257 RepID=A0ABY4EQ90_9BACI|nr:hypothetical protein [Halobacillus salinarum]UOQ46077.1 hypothetical protein MUN89_09240 [Halobacillus salinarum]